MSAPTAEAVKLEKLTISEVSGVDDPANELPGFLVMKSVSADALSDEALEQTLPETDSDATSIVGKIKTLLLGKEIDVTKEELDAALDARFQSLSESLTEQLSKSVEPGEGATESEAPAAVAEPVVVEAPAAEETPGEKLTADDIVKAVEDAQAPLLEIIDKTLDRIERIEGALALRKSLDGQETGDDDAPQTPKLADAVAKALRRPSNVAA